MGYWEAVVGYWEAVAGYCGLLREGGFIGCRSLI